MGTLRAFVLVCIGIIILRRTAPDLPPPFRTPWVPFALGALACLVQMLALPLSTWFRLLIWLGLGLLVYFAYGARRSTLRRAATEVDRAA